MREHEHLQGPRLVAHSDVDAGAPRSSRDLTNRPELLGTLRAYAAPRVWSGRRNARLRAAVALSLCFVGVSASLQVGSAGASSGRELVDALGRALRSVSQERIYHYEMEQVWPTAVRYLRVDRGYDITEQDASSGFLLFAVTLASGTKAKGSLEFVPVAGPGGRKSVKIKAQLGSGPAYITNAILDGVGQKLRSEVGQPTQPAPPPSEPPPEQPKPPVNPIDPEGPTDPVVLPPTQDPPKLFEGTGR